MKQLVGHDSGAGTYVFNAAAGTITFSGVTLTLEQILLVVDSTTSAILYSIGQPALGGTYAGGILTLTTLPVGASNTDHLQIYIDVPISLALETGGNLAAIKADVDKIPAQGQALAAGSTPVVLTAAQLTTLTPPAALTNVAQETGGNLAAIKADVDKIPAQGQALAAASTPVVLTAIQVAALTPPAALTNFANETGGNLAAAKADLDTLAGSISGGKQKMSAAVGDVIVEVSDGTNVVGTVAHPVQTQDQSTAAMKTDLDTIAGAVSGGKMSVKASAGDVAVNILGHGGAALDGTAGSPAAGVQTVQGVAGGTPQAVSLTDGVSLLGTSAHPVFTTQVAQGTNSSPAPTASTEEGLIAAISLPAAVANGSLIGAMGDKFGRAITISNGPRDLIAPASFQSTGASAVTFINAIAGVYIDIIHLILTNESATATIVSLTDGTNTYKFALAANGGCSIAFPTPLPAAAANHVWQISNSAAVAVDCIAIYVKNQ